MYDSKINEMIREKLKKKIMKELKKNYRKNKREVVHLAKRYGFDLYLAEFKNNTIGALINNIEKREIYLKANSSFYRKQRMVLYLLIEYFLNAKPLQPYAKVYYDNSEIEKDIGEMAEEILEGRKNRRRMEEE